MKKILVIEDNNEVRENLCEILELTNYITVEAADGKEGIKMVRSEKPDLIICDVMMPELDGFGVLRILNRDPVLMHIPFMFLTAKAEKLDFRKGMGLGADDYITKPFDEVDLLDAIEMRLKKSIHQSGIQSIGSGIKKLYSEEKATTALHLLLEGKEVRRYPKRSYIYEEGQYPRFLYYVKSGLLKAVQLADSGKELIMDVYSAGDYVGLQPLIQDHSYKDHTLCLGDSEIIAIPLDEFSLAMLNDKDFGLKVIRLLAKIAGEKDDRLLDLAFSSVRKKVSNAIVRFAKKIDSDSVALSRDDLASIAGTTRESVIRTLSDFKSESLIDTSGGQIRVLDMDKLANIFQ